MQSSGFRSLCTYSSQCRFSFTSQNFIVHQQATQKCVEMKGSVCRCLSVHPARTQFPGCVSEPLHKQYQLCHHSWWLVIKHFDVPLCFQGELTNCAGNFSTFHSPWFWELVVFTSFIELHHLRCFGCALMSEDARQSFFHSFHYICLSVTFKVKFNQWITISFIW